MHHISSYVYLLHSTLAWWIAHTYFRVLFMSILRWRIRIGSCFSVNKNHQFARVLGRIIRTIDTFSQPNSLRCSLGLETLLHNKNIFGSLHVLVLLSEPWKSPANILKLILLILQKKHLEGLILSELRLLKWEARRFKETLALFMASNVNTIICPLGCDYQVLVLKTEKKDTREVELQDTSPQKIYSWLEHPL